MEKSKAQELAKSFRERLSEMMKNRSWAQSNELVPITAEEPTQAEAAMTLEEFFESLPDASVPVNPL